MAADDESYGSNELRVAKQAEIDAAITEWTLSQPSATAVCTILDSVEVRVLVRYKCAQRSTRLDFAFDLRTALQSEQS